MSFKWLNVEERFDSDDYYTRLIDIEAELKHYQHYFKNKIVYCNCDDPKKSNFVRYFTQNYQKLGLKKLVSTHYINQQMDLFGDVPTKPELFTYDGVSTQKKPLKKDGDYRSPECLEILKDVDIVVTNPPFSLFRNFIDLLIHQNKQFIVIGSVNSLTHTNMYRHVTNGDLWAGVTPMTSDFYFEVPINVVQKMTQTNKVKGRAYKRENGKYLAIAPAMWFTNLHHFKRDEYINLKSKYCPKSYPKYDNLDAIEVSKYAEIPTDYTGLMGVPITYLQAHKPHQFELVDTNKGYGNEFLTIQHKPIYARWIIKNCV